MPCLLVVIAALFPRVMLVLAWLFTNMLERTYHGIIIPIIGFIFLPLTTLCYAWLVSSHLPIAGPYLVLLIVAVLIDAGGHGGSAQYYRRDW
jgi:hypothetical protein